MTEHPDQPWSRSAPAGAARELLLRGVFGPLIAGYATVQVSGRPGLDAIPGPVVLVANHSSHVDTPVLLRALPAARRRRTLVAAAADYWYASRALATAVSLAFGTVPLPRRREGETTSALAPLQELIAAGWSLVIFGEGTRSRSGRLGPFRSGAAALSRSAGVPLVPVHLDGTARLMPPGRAWMTRPGDGRRRHSVTVSFGAPLPPTPEGALTDTMNEVRRFMTARA